MNNKSRYIIFALALIILATVAYFFADGLIYKSAVNYTSSIKADSESISIQIADEDFEKIQKQRQESKERGSIVNKGNTYVSAKIIYKGDTLKAEMRLKGHMLDHVKGEKWSYRVKIKKGKSLFGMNKFTLQHPGTRNYAYEWVYHKMMQRENIVALRYDYITVDLNGRGLGIYAIEEHFTQDLIENNNRPNGAILRFNPNLYWVGRITRGNEKLKFSEEYSGYNASFPEAYDRRKTLSDSVLRKSYLTAQSLLEQFKLREVKTSDIFDVKKLADFHAIIDLIGGHHSLDWSDVKYYHNPESNLLEPVAYESFSAHDAKKISASNQFLKDNNSLNFHNNIFSDTIFFKEYMNSLKRVIQEDYIKEFFNDIDEELEKKLAIIYSEFPYKDFTTDVFYKNQKKIAKMLNEVKPFHVFLQEYSSNSITLALGSNSSLPYIIKAIKCGSQLVDVENTIIYSKVSKKVLEYDVFQFSITEELASKLKKEKNLILFVQLIGDDKVKEIEIFYYPYQYAIDKANKEANSVE